jgi:hypothetical protein
MLHETLYLNFVSHCQTELSADIRSLPLAVPQNSTEAFLVMDISHEISRLNQLDALRLASLSSLEFMATFFARV